VGRNWKNGTPMIITNPGIAEEMRISVLHLECVSSWAAEIYGDQEVVAHCMSCGDELDCVCEECSTQMCRDFGEDE
jgi:hypothetical protein